MSTPDALLAADALELAFGGVRAVDGVSFAVRAGAIQAVIGPNGAGKTSLFNLVSRIYAPTRGALSFQGQDLLRVPRHGVAALGIARTFQNLELFENGTVLENVLLGRFTHRRTGILADALFTPAARHAAREDRLAAERVIEFLDLERERDIPVHGLAYGRRKVVELARALAMAPKLLLLDEPSSGLNPEETEDLAFWLRDIRSLLGVTILMIEHDMGLVGAVSDSVVVLDYGRVIAEGTAADVQRDPAVVRAYLGAAPAEPAA